MSDVGVLKVCSTCKVAKATSEYYKNPAYSDGLYYNCRACHRESVRKYARTDKGKSNTNNKSYRMRDKYPEKNKARELIRAAVYAGKIIRPEACANCNKPCTPHGHHEDYSKPYEVDWLCDPCHKLRHGKLNDFSLLSPLTQEDKTNDYPTPTR